jgi:hypothetical protein
MWEACNSWKKTRETDSTLEPPERKPANTLNLEQRDPFQLDDLLNYKMINLCHFKVLSL